jgi:putative aminopeptidase FrvX
MADKTDIQNCIDLLTKAIQELDQHDWGMMGKIN